MNSLYYADQEREVTHVVYAPTLGYDVERDTGRRFQLETEASHYVLTLRRRGVFSWVEVE